jgi:predicted hydrocarbon binding protein
LTPNNYEAVTQNLQQNGQTVEAIHNRLMDLATKYLIESSPLPDRPRMGTGVHLHPAFHALGFPHLAGPRYRMAQRMGGTRTGRALAQWLVQKGKTSEEALEACLHLIDHCKAGVPKQGHTVRIYENVESLRTRYMTQIREPSCYFTTGFLSGIYAELFDHRVREVKCFAAENEYCEWEIVETSE